MILKERTLMWRAEGVVMCWRRRRRGGGGGGEWRLSMYMYVFSLVVVSSGVQVHSTYIHVDKGST